MVFKCRWAWLFKNSRTSFIFHPPYLKLKRVILRVDDKTFEACGSIYLEGL